jgi:hypothetical protein
MSDARADRLKAEAAALPHMTHEPFEIDRHAVQATVK